MWLLNHRIIAHTQTRIVYMTHTSRHIHIQSVSCHMPHCKTIVTPLLTISCSAWDVCIYISIWLRLWMFENSAISLHWCMKYKKNIVSTTNTSALLQVSLGFLFFAILSPCIHKTHSIKMKLVYNTHYKYICKYVNELCVALRDRYGRSGIIFSFDIKVKRKCGK